MQTHSNQQQLIQASNPTAVRGTFQPRPGSADCSSYFRVTVTPAASTSTITETYYSTSSETVSLTATSTDFRTLTVVQPTTLTTELSITTTITIKPPGQVPGKLKRQVTVVPSKIPAYASPCSGSVRYSSACSCRSISHVTVTLPSPTTVVTTKLMISTTETSTDLKMITVTSTEGTITRTTTDATKTETKVIATQTAHAFILQVADGVPAAGGQYIQARVDAAAGTPPPLIFKFTTVRSDATKLLIRHDGRLVAYDNGWGVYAGWLDNSWTSSFIYIHSFQFNGLHTLSCSFNAAWEISCSGAPPPYTDLGTYSNGYSLNIGVSGFNFGSIAGEGPIVVKALPF
ncbi:hypothetical protein ABW20_dc0107502 [Dactylellina cionopaga]|nr:hypothetical protein ABW20_dc0107502 [Dactylellina cionopaga]